ncbi:MAG: sodium:alanine symporter family protein [Clostridia bacterium]|nr:sodium:alanine symporter family protein [Clostridia bacterium]
MEALGRFTYWVYGVPLMILVVFAGVRFTLCTRFFQLRRLKCILKTPFARDMDSAEGQMTPFQAMSMAIGGSVGVANISGVSTALVTGGVGALFWMLVSAFLGMAIKMAEVTLACFYRHRDEEGRLWGGPTYYIQKFLGQERGCKWWRVPALLFGGGIFVSFFINVQNYSVAEAIGTTFDIPFMIPSLILAAVTYVMVSGGLRRLGTLCSYLVPFMCLFYIGCVLTVLFRCRDNILPSLRLIVTNAFSLRPAVGGIAGSCLAVSLRTGFARALYSNEAGWGTSPMVHATAECSHPVRQGMLGAFEVFADTALVCTATGLLVVCTGMHDSGLMGAELTLKALENYLGSPARIAVALSVFLFGLTSALGWYAYYLTLLHHGLGEGRTKKLLPLFNLLMPAMGAGLTLAAVKLDLDPGKIWLIADFSAIFPTAVNLCVLLTMTDRFVCLVKDWENKNTKQRPKSAVSYRVRG